MKRCSQEGEAPYGKERHPQEGTGVFRKGMEKRPREGKGVLGRTNEFSGEKALREQQVLWEKKHQEGEGFVFRIFN